LTVPLDVEHAHARRHWRDVQPLAPLNQRARKADEHSLRMLLSLLLLRHLKLRQLGPEQRLR